MCLTCGGKTELEHKEIGHKDGDYALAQHCTDARDCDLCDATRAAIKAGLRPKWAYSIGCDRKRHQHVQVY